MRSPGAPARRGPSSNRARPGSTRRPRRRRRSSRRRRRSTSSRPLRKARRAAAKPFAKAVATELHGIGLGEGEFHVELGEREPSAAGLDTVSFLIRPNAGLPFAPARDRVRRRAVPHRSRNRRGSRREDDARLRRDRCGHRRPDRARCRADVATALRALQIVTITHLPQIASVADRHFSVEKVAGDPTYHPHRGARRRRTPRGTRTSARRSRVSLDRSMSFVEYTGPARLDRRTKQLVRRLSADDIAIIDHADLDRRVGRGAARVRCPRRVQRRRVPDGAVPSTRGPSARPGRRASDRRARS